MILGIVDGAFSTHLDSNLLRDHGSGLRYLRASLNYWCTTLVMKMLSVGTTTADSSSLVVLGFENGGGAWALICSLDLLYDIFEALSLQSLMLVMSGRTSIWSSFILLSIRLFYCDLVGLL